MSPRQTKWRWTIRSPERDEEGARKSGRSRLSALAVTLASAVIVITCSTSHEHAAPPATPALPVVEEGSPGKPPVSSSMAAPELSSAPSVLASELPPEAVDAEPSPSADAGAAPSRAGHELDRFHAGLRELEQHTRKDHVRIAWIGDSHGASDLWSGQLRTALQKRFGAGGLGFVHVGHKGYRHDGVKMDFIGKWRQYPKGPSTIRHTGNGVFGLGGFLMVGQEGSPRAILAAKEPGLPAELTWDLCYRLPSAKDAFLVTLTGAKDANVAATAAEPAGPLRHFILTSNGVEPTLRVTPIHGFPEFCGVVVEADPKTQPGVVLDTLGINGARLGTPLAWDEASWVEELRRRSPALVILEYGTNEAGDHIIEPALYTSRLTQVMARVHAASPSCDCLVLAPTDRADTLERTPLVRDALQSAARAVGCGFWDTYAVMGGKGSILLWRAEMPPRAASDGVHLSIRGYRELGDRLAADMIAGYTP